MTGSVWSLGDDPAIARDILAPPAGADVVALDPAPELIDAGRDEAAGRATGTQHRVGLLHSERFADVEEATSLSMANFGPAVALSAQLPPERTATLRDAIAAWGRTAMESGALEMEHLPTIARRA